MIPIPIPIIPLPIPLPLGLIWKAVEFIWNFLIGLF